MKAFGLYAIGHLIFIAVGKSRVGADAGLLGIAETISIGVGGGLLGWRIDADGGQLRHRHTCCLRFGGLVLCGGGQWALVWAKFDITEHRPFLVRGCGLLGLCFGLRDLRVEK